MLKTLFVLVGMVIVGATTMFFTAISLGKPKTSHEYQVNTVVVWGTAIIASLAFGALAQYLGRRR